MGCLEHADLNIDTDSLFDKTSLLIEFGSLWPLLHLLADTSDFNDQVLIIELLGNLHAAGHASHFYGSTSDASVALSVVLFNVDPLVTDFCRWVNVGPLVELLSLGSVSLVLDLASKFAADELLALRRNRLCELKGCEPILKIHSHVESELGLGTAKEHLLSCVWLEQDASNVANQDILLSLVLD